MVRDLPTESLAWGEVERQSLNINEPDFKGQVTFRDLAEHYLTNEVLNPTRKQQKKAHTTVEDYSRIVNMRLLPAGERDRLCESSRLRSSVGWMLFRKRKS